MNSILKILSSLLCLFIITMVSAIAQDDGVNYIPEGRYLVIGSFHIKQNALGFTEYVRKMDKYDVKMAYHPVKQYYHVYIKGYNEDQDGFDDVKNMRQQTEFIDTWFMVVTPYDVKDNTKPAVAQVEDIPVVKEVETVEEKQDTNSSDGWIRAVSPSLADNSNPEPEVDSIPEQEPGWVKVSSISGTGAGKSGSKIVPKSYVEKGKYKLYFNAFYVKNFKEIKGGVEIINPKTLRLMRVAQSLELVKIADPNNGTHSVQLIANIFGYKKVQHDIKLDEPFDEVNEEFFYFKGDTLVADFPLQRYDQGDIATMYNVFFFKDAAVMKSNSKFELNSLVDMLKENEDLKIKIHGHTNGSARGKIITLPVDSEQFFTLNQEVEEKYGSAKDLSLQRAEVIKNYLISYGLVESRMEVIGWGGKKPIYDKMDKLAIKNVRVEIEILEN